MVLEKPLRLGPSLAFDVYQCLFQELYHKVRNIFTRNVYPSVWDIEQPLDLLNEQPFEPSIGGDHDTKVTQE